MRPDQASIHFRRTRDHLTINHESPFKTQIAYPNKALPRDESRIRNMGGQEFFSLKKIEKIILKRNFFKILADHFLCRNLKRISLNM
jgi:hypothetical protein